MSNEKTFDNYTQTSIFGAGASDSHKQTATNAAAKVGAVLLTNETEGRVSGGDRAGSSYIRGGSDGKSRNGEAEAVANAVGRESVAMDESSNTWKKSRPSHGRQFSAN